MSARRDAAGSTPATAALARAGVAFTLHPYHHDPASTHFGDEAAAALGVDPTRIFKTLVVQLTGGRTPLACAVVPVAEQLGPKTLAEALHAKRAALADQQVAERTTGYLVGGISPLGQKRQLPVLVDSSAQLLETMFVSAGRRGLQVELAPADLVRVCRGTFVPLTHPGSPRP